MTCQDPLLDVFAQPAFAMRDSQIQIRFSHILGNVTSFHSCSELTPTMNKLFFHHQETENKSNNNDSKQAKKKSESEIQGKSLENLRQSQKLTQKAKIRGDENINSCPQDFVRVGSTCYYISLAKVVTVIKSDWLD